MKHRSGNHHSPGSSGGKGSLRQWATPSYDPNTGRSASSVDEQNSREHVYSGNHAKSNAQMPRADSGFQARDKRWTQNRTPVHKRPIG